MLIKCVIKSHKASKLLMIFLIFIAWF